MVMDTLHFSWLPEKRSRRMTTLDSFVFGSLTLVSDIGLMALAQLTVFQGIGIFILSVATFLLGMALYRKFKN
jgi:hypothetical protein